MKKSPTGYVVWQEPEESGTCAWCGRAPTSVFHLQNTVTEKHREWLAECVRMGGEHTRKLFGERPEPVHYNLYFCSLVCIHKWTEKVLFDVKE